MKSDWRVYVRAGLLITLMLLAAAGLVWLVHPWLTQWLGAYHLLAETALFFVAYGLLSSLAVRLVLALKPLPVGEYSYDSAEFGHWQLLTVIYRLGQGALRWLMPFYMQPLLDALFGARIGPDVAFGGTIDDPYRVTVGPGAVLGHASLVSGNFIDASKAKLVCGTVVIGQGATVGANCVVWPNTSIGDGAVLQSGSYLMPGHHIPAGETWRGNPARKWM